MDPFELHGCGAVEKVFRQFLEDLQERVAQCEVNQTVPTLDDTDLAKLKHLFPTEKTREAKDQPTLVQNALEILDRNRISAYVSPNGRSQYTITYKTEKSRVCLPPFTFCSCTFFLEEVINTPKNRKDPLPLCEHLLAIRLGRVLKKVKLTQVSDERINEIIAESYS